MTSLGIPTRLSGHGLEVELPHQWEGRIYQRSVESSAVYSLPGGWARERTHPVMHLANFALPAVRGDYGSGAVEHMGVADIFIALLEFGADCLGTALYRPLGLPQIKPGQFNPNGLQRRIAGQAGVQHFFTDNDRPFCLYVVIGAHERAATSAAVVNTVLKRIETQR